MMTTIDSSVLLAIFNAESDGPHWLEALIEARREGRLLICEIVYAEIAPAFDSPQSLDQRLERLGITQCSRRQSYATAVRPRTRPSPTQSRSESHFARCRIMEQSAIICTCPAEFLAERQMIGGDRGDCGLGHFDFPHRKMIAQKYMVQAENGQHRGKARPDGFKRIF